MKKLSLILVAILLISVLGCALPGAAFAQELTTDKYTDVLTDMQKDETFDVSKYPEKANDYSLSVFQVAEGKDGEVFLYVYQPSGEAVTASEVRISTGIGDDLSPQDYTLTCLGTKGALSKYMVNDLPVKSDTVRYYYVVQIARPWDKNLGDKEPTSDNKISTVAYPVAKLFTAYTADGKVTYSETHEEVITITAKYCGYIRNFTGWLIDAAETDSHFIAFDTDRRIEKLMEATVTYNWRSYQYSENILTGLTVIGTYSEDKEEHTGVVTELKANESHTIGTFGLFGKEYTWYEIESVQDFMKREEVTREAKEAMQGKKWVLRFALTPVIKRLIDVSHYGVFAMKVTDASILRLKFETAGNVYNLGVVDNKQTEGDKPSSPTSDSKLQEALEDIDSFWNKLKGAWNWLVEHWWIFVILGVILLLGILSPFVPFIAMGFKAVGKGIAFVLKYICIGLWYLIKYFFIGLYYVIASPIYLIIRIVRKVKERKG